MTDQELIETLWRYGHFVNPDYANGPSRAVAEADLPNLTLNDAAVQEAVRSYQHFQRPVFDELAIAHHGRRGIADGEVGDATRELLEIPRCGQPDFVLTEEAIGSGRWGQCKLDQYPNNNAITIAWDTSRMPSFVQPVFDQVWHNVFTAYAELGLALVREDGNGQANIRCRFTDPQRESGNLRGNWIGLAIVAWNGIRCSDSNWALFDEGYQPRNVVNEWTTLVKHEIGHGCGLQHSSGGVMNPSIVNGLPVSWRGDPSWSTLARWYGGEPIENQPQPPPPVPPTGNGYIPDLEIIYQGKPYRAFPKAGV